MEVLDTSLWEESSISWTNEEVGDDEEQDLAEGSPDHSARKGDMVYARWLWMMVGAANDVLSILKLVRWMLLHSSWKSPLK